MPPKTSVKKSRKRNTSIKHPIDEDRISRKREVHCQQLRDSIEDQTKPYLDELNRPNTIWKRVLGLNSEEEIPPTAKEDIANIIRAYVKQSVAKTCGGVLDKSFTEHATHLRRHVLKQLVKEANALAKK